MYLFLITQLRCVLSIKNINLKIYKMHNWKENSEKTLEYFRKNN